MLPLERLTIHQFRGLRDVELHELGRFNVFVGLNNSGKTTVLEAIATYARPLRPSEWVDVVRRRDVASRAAVIEGLRWLFPQPLDGEPPSSAPFDGTTKLSAEGRFPVRETHAHFTEVEGFFDDADEVPSGRFGGRLGGRPEDSGVRRGAELALRAVIEPDNPSLFGKTPREEQFSVMLWESGRGPIAQNLSGPALPVATITPFSHRYQQIEVEALSDALFADLKPMVLDLVRIFDPLIEDFEILKRPRSEPAVYLRHARLGKAPLSSFGDGMRRVLLMGVSLAMVRGGVLLVDEIESAIHVEALDASFRWLQRACRELDVQVFTTTHSLEAVDALVAAGGDADDLVLYRLEREDAAARVKRFSLDRLRLLREELGQEIRS
jgi:energy-coupling factor transporter ATP-binding protein EcfA2